MFYSNFYHVSKNIIASFEISIKNFTRLEITRSKVTVLPGWKFFQLWKWAIIDSRPQVLKWPISKNGLFWI